jgi:hypothetical protein
MKETNMTSDRDFYLKEISDILRTSLEENERRHQELLGLREEELAQARENTRVLQEMYELNKERVQADVEFLEQRKELERKAAEKFLSEDFEKLVKKIYGNDFKEMVNRIYGSLRDENLNLSERSIPPE